MTTLPTEIQRQVEAQGLSATLDEVLYREEIARDQLLHWKHIRQELQKIIPKPTESPIEKIFFDNAQHIPALSVQYEIGPYRVDFAIPDQMIVIELDGHDYHKTKEQRTNDAKRERELKLLGWDVIRFTGSEIYQDVTKCVAQVLEIIDRRHYAGN
jgi:hypothetical protein